MELTGIVAEYNPFHNGHAYQIAQAKKLHPSDGIVAVMSGNFSQRGEAAVFDKWTRAELALHGGVDLVLELPVTFAVRSAGYFADGAVRSLAATGVVTALSCGVESTDTNELQQLARYLSREPDDFRRELQTQLGLGLSYPSARQKALETLQVPGTDRMHLPNNQLALQYLQTIYRDNLSMDPVLIPRQGDYHSDTIPQAGYASASAIRALLLAEDSAWQQQVSPAAQQVILRHIQQGYAPMYTEQFAQILFFLLRRSTPQQLAELTEMQEGLENRLYEAAFRTETLEELCTAVKSKRYTYTRICRSLIHLLLNMTDPNPPKEPQYLRVLGFNSTGRQILKEMRKKAQLPVLMRPARQRRELNKAAQRMLALDCRATDLYHMAYSAPALRTAALDLTRGPVML